MGAANYGALVFQISLPVGKPKGGKTMTMEQLLAPRFKVKDKYPGMEMEPFRLDQIITLTKHETDGWIHIPIKHIPGSYMRIGFFEAFPNIFEPLPWWKERKVEDMPRYVRSIKQEYQYGIEIGKVIKVKEWVLLSKTMYVIQSKTREYHPSCFVPASKEDYNDYLQTTNQLNNGQ